METNDEINVGLWVDDRLATLTPPENWCPDLATGLDRFNRRRLITGAPRGTWALAIAGGLCVCALIFPATRVFARRCLNACVVETNLVAEKLLWRGRADSAQAFGRVVEIGGRSFAPDFALPDMSGKTVRFSEFRGQVVLVNFWATWCSPCKVEIPWFVEMQRAYQGAGLTILGVSMDEDGWKSVKPYIEEHRVNYRVLVGKDEILREFGWTDCLPVTLIIDKACRIAVRHAGLVAKNTYDKEVRSLLEEK